MNKDAIESFFRLHYQAVPAEPTLCRSFLEADRQLILGLAFPDAAANYALLSDSDLRSFPPETARKIRTERLSPFHDMLLIFYEEGGKPHFKLVNGMGSRLFSLAQGFCST